MYDVKLLVLLTNNLIFTCILYCTYRIFTKNGTEVVVDSSSFEFIKGSTIDYVQEMIHSKFAVTNNPQSESACGCGSSFAVKNFSVNPAKD